MQGNPWLYVACDRQAAEFLLIRADLENSWASNPGFEPSPLVQQAGIFPRDYSAAGMYVYKCKGILHQNAVIKREKRTTQY